MSLLLIDNDTCLINRKSNKTIISNVYEGIPETLLLNVISWIVLILLFALLRNRAWDYGRLALVHSEKWTQLFYKNTDDAVAVEETNHEVSLIPDTGCLWLPSVFKITKEQIYSRCGPDASHYLSFQIQLFFLMLVITIFSICVVLPINFQGTLLGDKTTFGHTTIGNLPSDSKMLWVHIAGSIGVVPVMIFIMRKCSGRLPISSNLSSRTLLVTNISKHHRNCEDIKNYFTVRYPGIEVKDVKIPYKIRKLALLERQREKIHESRMYCESHIQKSDIKFQPRGCIVCCPCRTENALIYYTKREEELNHLVALERRKALQNPLGIAFVTLNSDEMAQYVLKSFEAGSHRNWVIFKAPSPSDINWENLEISYRNWYSKAIIINALLFIILFFLTTPVIVVNIFNNLTNSQENWIEKISPILSEFLPTLLLLSMSAVMPVMVAYSDEWMSHWTKSKQNHATMYKAFFFLLFMVLILPSLGLTSAQAFLEWSVQTQNITLRWECIFLADKGAFFVNYVITSALIGTALELLRFPELAMYAWRLLLIKSEAEKTSIRKEILSVFPFGIHYAWTLLIFTICTVYSLTCPLITPFGLLYLCLKHYVDKYNIYYVYRPITMSGEGQRIHAGAIKMVRIAILLLQLITALFLSLRAQLSPTACIAFLGFALTGIVFSFIGPFPSCKQPLNTFNTPAVNEEYIAPVLISSSAIETVDVVRTSSIFCDVSNQNYNIKLDVTGISEA
ncbi:calcium permeable stress-gated cation channel 1 [Diorhabda sublineata]|uniref:calcium permeable stress-gated cation channel 1 n=1 Tax=Diorhabda sublineata TaxID=1163346 RepID=UPI0024E1531C|nr:calcium permeable stress-gated cation channel 1 [Diorhabda sublineata]